MRNQERLRYLRGNTTKECSYIEIYTLSMETATALEQFIGSGVWGRVHVLVCLLSLSRIKIHVSLGGCSRASYVISFLFGGVLRFMHI